MEEDVKKIFNILGVEPNEKFKLCFSDNTSFLEDNTFYFNDELHCCYIDKYLGERYREDILRRLFIGDLVIVKLFKKKKLRDWTMEDFKKWEDVNCKGVCDDCPFTNVHCNDNAKRFWMNHKDLFSDEFLNQEIDVPGGKIK